MDNILLLVFILILLFISILITLYFYSLRSNFSFIKLIKETSLLSKVLFIILILYLISIPIQFLIYSRNISYNNQDLSSRFNDIVDVNDGVVAVGWQEKALFDGKNTTYMMPRAAIKKYSYDGNLIWEKVYFIDVERSTEFLNVKVNQNGNYLVSGIDDDKTMLFIIYNPDGELVDQQIVDDVNYSRVLSDDNILNAVYDSYNFENGLSFSLMSTEKEKLYEFQYNYHNPINTKYNKFYRVGFVGESQNHIFLTLETLQVDYVFLEVRLLVFNKNLELIDEYIYLGDYSITKVIEDRQSYHIAWNNENKRTCFYGEYTKSMNLIRKIDIVGKTAFTSLKDMHYINNSLYFFGNEYTNEQQKHQTNDNYTGFMLTGSIYNNFEYYLFGKGIEIKSSFIKNETLYTTGMFDSKSAFLSNSAYYDYSNKGIITIYDLNKKKVINKIFMT